MFRYALLLFRGTTVAQNYTIIRVEKWWIELLSLFLCKRTQMIEFILKIVANIFAWGVIIGYIIYLYQAYKRAVK